MPRVLGLNLVGVLVATLAFWMVGFVWYGLVFAEIWMEANGVTAETAGAGGSLYMLGGFVITLMQVIGIGLVLKWKGVATMGAAVMTAVILWFFLALPFANYAYLYSPAHNTTLLLIDASHLLVGWVVSAVVLSLIK
ncbi:DUF1761 domain-containing protein [Hyphococcus lacteus]|uniref:DUF1761 domain-containing protein n=1 Tax=Hyphococcus lacteus TaxID=3143536 RepID=A0ABV3Z3U8_9PROT